MSRLRLFTFPPESALHKLLFQRKFHTESSNHVSQFQRAFIHSPTCGYRPGYSGKYVVVPGQQLSWKRFIHATGVCLSGRRDPYAVLGISKSASLNEIKKAFHALAKKFHPDTNKNNPSANRKFLEIRDAYETLQDHQKKAEYDRMRKNSGRSKKAEYSNRDREQSRYANRTGFSYSFEETNDENNPADGWQRWVNHATSPVCIRKISTFLMGLYIFDKVLEW